MIIVSYKNAPFPLIGRVKGVTVHRQILAGTRATLLADAMKRFPDEKHCFLYVAPGAHVSTAPVYGYLNVRKFDVAACVDRVGSTPVTPRQFDGIGNVSLDTIIVRPTSAAVRLIDRWVQRNDAYPGKEAVNFCVALAETKEVVFSFLGPEWRWVESAMQPLLGGWSGPIVTFSGNGEAPAPIEVQPKIQDLSAAKKDEPVASRKRGPEVVWVGHFFQYTGYGKMNRELLLRVANSLSVHIDDTHKEPVYVSEDLRSRLDVYKRVLVGEHAPLLRCMGPDHITTGKRHRIVYTMQESSERVHADMVKRANENFDELWTPTLWNAEVFRASGVKLPMRVVPLGVDTAVYRPMFRKTMPECRLISTSKRGTRGVPKGFTFLTVGLPGFRKGWDVVADALETAFSSRPGAASLVIALTHSPGGWNEKIYRQFANYKVPIWTLEGSFGEYELADVYNAAGAYVSASRGEGFNLPALEAAACGRPVIVPDNTAHTEIFGPEAYLFSPDGLKKYPEGDWISDWYKGMLFSRFGKPAVRRLAAVLEHVAGGKSVRTVDLLEKVRRKYTWDVAARAVVDRLQEVQP